MTLALLSCAVAYTSDSKVSDYQQWDNRLFRMEPVIIKN